MDEINLELLVVITNLAIIAASAWLAIVTAKDANITQRAAQHDLSEALKREQEAAHSLELDDKPPTNAEGLVRHHDLDEEDEK